MTRVAWVSLLVLLVACEKGDGEGAGAKQPVLQPKNPPPAAADAAPVEKSAETATSACPPVVVAVKPDGVWIRDQGSQSVIAPCGGEIDKAALALRLCTLASAAPAHCTAVEVAADTGVKYQQIITVMDTAIAVGLSDVGLVDIGSLSVPLRVPPDPTDKVAPQCQKEVPACPARPATTHARGPGTIPPAGPRPSGTVADAIVIVVPAAGSITVNGKQVATARQAGAGERIEPLFKELKAAPNPDGTRAVVLQVDRDTDARLVNRIISTAKAAGFDDVLFAVKNK